jgi:hypothetical protein
MSHIWERSLMTAESAVIVKVSHQKEPSSISDLWWCNRDLKFSPLFTSFYRSKYHEDWIIHQLEVKVRFFLVLKHHTMHTYGGRGSTAPHILNLGTRWKRVVSFTPRPVFRKKRTRYPLDRRLGGLQSRFGRWREKSCLPGVKPWTSSQ